MTATSPPGSGPVVRSDLRAVALPTEHGGWGLTAEPVLLGLLVEPGVAGICLGLAALLAFMARTPLKFLLVDAYRDRRSERAASARAVLAVEVGAIVLLGTAAALAADASSWWVPLAFAAPLVGVELWFDTRSRSRRLVPELSGAAGIASVAAAVVLAGGGPAGLAVASWMVLAARAVSSIPYVRGQIARLHGHPVRSGNAVLADGSALVLAAVAAVMAPQVAAGTAGVVLVLVAQRLWARGPVPAAKVLGLRQMALGFGLVVLTAVGVRL